MQNLTNYHDESNFNDADYLASLDNQALSDPETGDFAQSVPRETPAYPKIEELTPVKSFSQSLRSSDPLTEMFSSCEIYERIDNTADSYGISTVSLFVGVLAKLSSLIPPTLHTSDGGAIKPDTMNLYHSMVGPPGSGKSLALKAINQLIPNPMDFSEFVGWQQIQPGTGEALEAAFCSDIDILDKMGEETGAKFGRPNAYIASAEGTDLLIRSSRAGSTLNVKLVAAWAVESLTTTLATKGLSRQVPEKSYSLGMNMGIQPGKAGPLMDDETLGFPQRFIFTTVERANRKPFDPKGWKKTYPVLPLGLHHDWKLPPTDIQTPVVDDTQMTMDEAVSDALWFLKDSRELRDNLDVHQSWNMNRLCHLIALLHGRTHVQLVDFQHAELIYEHSRTTRSAMKEAILIEQGRQEREAAKARDMNDELSKEEDVKKTLAKLEKAGDEGCTLNQLRIGSGHPQLRNQRALEALEALEGKATKIGDRWKLREFVEM